MCYAFADVGLRMPGARMTEKEGFYSISKRFSLQNNKFKCVGIIITLFEKNSRILISFAFLK